MTPELIREVKKVNRQAALWMVKKIPLLVKRGIVLPAFGFETEMRLTNRLPDTFTFRTTPHGFKYWDKISDQLPKGYGW